MPIKAIKELPDKTAIATVSGIVEKQYAPAEQTENDKKFSQHRQSLLINDGEEKLMVTLMKSQLHILDSVEGYELILTAGQNEKGEKRGLLLNKWQPADSKYPKVSLKVYPEATIRAVPPKAGESEQEPPPPQKNKSTPSPTPSNTMSEASQFEKHLTICARGLSLCLDKAQEIVESREHLQKDPENVRALAISMFIESKHHLQSLNIVQNGKPVNREPSAPTKEASTPESKSADPIARCMKALAIFEEKGEEGMSPAAVKVMNKLVEQLDDEGWWDQAYDRLLADIQHGTSIETSQKLADAANTIFDQSNSQDPEKYFVSHPAQWRDLVLEQAGRDAGY